MSPIPKSGSIIVTHYANPHLFWFKYINDADAENRLVQLEFDIKQYIDSKRSYDHNPVIGEIVLAYYVSIDQKKWIRARVDHQLCYSRGVKFVLWAIDFGFPLYSEARLIRQLKSETLIHARHHIHKGGLHGLLPATNKYSFVTSSSQTFVKDRWSTNAVKLIEKFICESKSLTFRCKSYLEDHYFGSLITVSTNGTDITASDILKETFEATSSENFSKDAKNLQIKPYWEIQNDESIFKIKENSSSFESNEDNESVVSLYHKLAECVSPISENNHSDDNKSVISETYSFDKMCSIPMNKRFAVAQRNKTNENETDKNEMITKNRLIDEINKRTVSLPAGFIVSDPRAIAGNESKRREWNTVNVQQAKHKETTKQFRNKSYYERAVDDEKW